MCNFIIYPILVAMSLFFAGLSFYVLMPKIRSAVGQIMSRSKRGGKIVFLLGVAFATMYGGSKHVYNVSYPRTDPDVWYVKDAGSCSSNDYIYVSFQRNVIVPRTANFFIDGYPASITNSAEIQENMVNVFSNTFNNLEVDDVMVPFYINYSNATNYRFIAYTDWVPAPTVHTNGIAYVIWQISMPKTNDTELALLRTGVYTNGVKLFPFASLTNGPSFILLQTTSGDTNE